LTPSKAIRPSIRGKATAFAASVSVWGGVNVRIPSSISPILA
jgi:hypothetical protein